MLECKMLFSLISIFVLASAVGTDCPAGWKYFESKCYFLFHKERYFSTSREECMKHEGDLVSIESEEENDFVCKLIAASKHSEAWIGYRKDGSEYKWVDGSTFKTPFTKWMSGKPSGDGKCSEMIPGGEWVNILCFNTIAFVCKRDPKPSKGTDNLRLILTITIPVSCIFIMFVFVAFLCVKSHRELEAVESQVKETIPFEIVKAAMVLPMSKPPDLLDRKVKTEWQGAIKSISKTKSDKDLRNINSSFDDNNQSVGKSEVTSTDGVNTAVKQEVKEDENERRCKTNLINCLNRKSSKSSKGIPQVLPEDDSKSSEQRKSTELQPKLLIQTPPSFSPTDDNTLGRTSSGGETNYISKVDKWLKESPESPTRRNCTRESSVRRKHFQQSRGSRKIKPPSETPEIVEIEYESEARNRVDNNNTENEVTKFRKPTIQRQNVISVTADINFPRNMTMSSDLEPSSQAPSPLPSPSPSPCLNNDKRRKRPVYIAPEEKVINDNFLFLKTLNYSQETDFSDLSEPPRNQEVGNSTDEHKHDNGKVVPTVADDPQVSYIGESKLKEEYQLVTFV